MKKTTVTLLISLILVIVIVTILGVKWLMNREPILVNSIDLDMQVEHGD